MTKALPSICYLCGQPLAEPISWDHVPLKQLYADDVRRNHNPTKLLTIPVHKGCNEAYHLDEDYFVNTLVPFAQDSYAGAAVYQEVLQKFRRGKNVPLLNKVLREFDPRPSGLILPNNLVAKRFEGARIQRIAWKIVRGLYFHLFNIAFPEDWTTGVTVTAPGQMPPEHFQNFMRLPDNPSHGEYQSVFAYRFLKFPGSNDMHYWALLLWDRIIVTIAFHDVTCTCKECAPNLHSHSIVPGGLLVTS